MLSDTVERNVQSIQYTIGIVFALCLPFSLHATEANQAPLLVDFQSPYTLYSKASVAKLYKEHTSSKVWNKEAIKELVVTIENSSSHGLIPQDYHLDALQKNNIAEVNYDILASDAFLTLADHLLNGKIDPVSLQPIWTEQHKQKDLVDYLVENLKTNNIQNSLEDLAPSQPQYTSLKNALQKYISIQKSGGWTAVPNSNLLKPGQNSEHIPALRSRLIATGDLDPSRSESTLFDEVLVEAVKKYQTRVNLEPDGIVGPATFKQLNQSPLNRINQLIVNLERWRWLPDDLGERHIRINIADYQLEAHEGSDIYKIHDIVVGRTNRQTPIFSANIDYIVLNPWWDAPSLLAKLDLLPKFQNNPNIIQKLGYQILDKEGVLVDATTINWEDYSTSYFPFKIRQEPGINNAMGQVKFIFPNEYDVYMHDTPAKELFNKTRRDFSSGCIRVKNPIALLEWVLHANLDWSRTRIDAQLKTGKETRINLNKKIPVYLLYWTAVIDDITGDVYFIDDIYDRDTKVLALMEQRSIQD